MYPLENDANFFNHDFDFGWSFRPAKLSGAVLFEIISEGASWMNKIWASFQCSKRRFKPVFRSSKHEIGIAFKGDLYASLGSCSRVVSLTEAEKVFRSPAAKSPLSVN